MAFTTPGSHSLRLGRRHYPVTLPSVRDPRLGVAAVILSLQVLGQTVFGFKVSIAQILTAIVTAGLLEVVITFGRRGVIAWPASALLTGSSVALILRVTGTQHGQWWSLHGAWIFAATAAVSVVSKHVIRVGNEHVFNPSNIGLVLCFVLLGSGRVNPLDLWWARPGWGLALALAIIVIGGLVIVSRLGMLRVAVAFWVTFAACMGVIAAAGHAITTRWHVGPVQGELFWWVLVTSPEILVFLFFMITDPKTAPKGRVSQVIYGMGVAVVASLLAAPQQTEFATKVAILSGLAVVCALRVPLERLVPAPDTERDNPLRWFLGTSQGLRSAAPGHGPRPIVARVAVWLSVAAIVAGLLVVAGIPARSAASTAGGPVVITGRPVVRIGDASLPSVSIGSDAHTLDASISQHQARDIARDLLADLIITARAERRLDVRLAATAGTGSWLTQVKLRIEFARQDHRIDVNSYAFTHISIVVVRTRYWASPQLGAQTHGTINQLTYDLTQPNAVVARSTSPYHRTFVVVASGTHYLIAADDVP